MFDDSNSSNDEEDVEFDDTTNEEFQLHNLRKRSASSINMGIAAPEGIAVDNEMEEEDSESDYEYEEDDNEFDDNYFLNIKPNKKRRKSQILNLNISATIKAQKKLNASLEKKTISFPTTGWIFIHENVSELLTIYINSKLRKILQSKFSKEEIRSIVAHEINCGSKLVTVRSRMTSIQQFFFFITVFKKLEPTLEKVS
jgi:hypothetical protein